MFKLSLQIIFIYLLSISLTYAATVIVKVNNIETKGEIHLAIYDDADVFESDNGERGGAAKGITQGVIEEVKTGSVTYKFELPDDTYAIGIFVDTNYNNKKSHPFCMYVYKNEWYEYLKEKKYKIPSNKKWIE